MEVLPVQLIPLLSRRILTPRNKHNGDFTEGKKKDYAVRHAVIDRDGIVNYKLLSPTINNYQ